MKAMFSIMAVVSSLAFTAAIAFANPAMMKKKFEGYPNPDGGTTATGEAANLKGAEDAPKELKTQNQGAMGGVADETQLKRTEDSRIPKVVGPGHVDVSKGVTEGHFKEATKVEAKPKE